MEFENYSERNKSLKNFDTFQKPDNKYKKVNRFSVKKGEMVTTSVVKTKFSQLNDKRFYFPNGVLSLPFRHTSLNEISDLKFEKGQKIEQYFWEEKEIYFKCKKKGTQ